MKIIGKISEHELIATVSRDELARLTGFNSAYLMKNEGATFTVGAAVEINALWDALQFERTRPSDLANTAKQLRTAADKLDKINHALACPIADVVKP